LGARAGYFRFRRDGQTWFAVFYGSFTTRPQAEKEAKALKKRLPAEAPWVRLLGDIQQLIRPGRKG
jgi:septal ring-binding cell division protein DamX